MQKIIKLSNLGLRSNSESIYAGNIGFIVKRVLYSKRTGASNVIETRRILMWLFLCIGWMLIPKGFAEVAPGFDPIFYSQYELHVDKTRSDTLWFAPKIGTIASNNNAAAYVRIGQSAHNSESPSNIRIEAIVSSLPTLQDMIALKQAAAQLGYRNLRPIKPTSSDFRLLAIGEEIDLKQKLSCYPLKFGNIEFKQCFYLPFSTPWEAEKAGGFYLRQLQDTPMVARVAYLQTHLDNSLNSMIGNVLSVSDRWDAFLMLIHEWNYLSPDILKASYQIDFPKMAEIIQNVLGSEDFLSESLLAQLKIQIQNCQCGIRFESLLHDQQKIALDYYLTREFFQTLYVVSSQIPERNHRFTKIFIPSLGPQVHFALKEGVSELTSNIKAYTSEFAEQVMSAGRPIRNLIEFLPLPDLSIDGLPSLPRPPLVNIPPLPFVSSANISSDDYQSNSHHRSYSHLLESIPLLMNRHNEGPKGDRIQGRVIFDLHCISGDIRPITSFQGQGHLWQLGMQSLSNNGYTWNQGMNGCEAQKYMHMGFNTPF